MTDNSINPDDAFAVGPEDFQFACPYLGLERDAATHARQPTPLHRCYRNIDKIFAPVERHQIRFCLSEAHTTCRVFVEPGWRPPAGRAHSPNALGKRAPSLGPGARKNRTFSGGSFLLAAILVAFAIAAGLITARILATFGTSVDSAAPKGSDTAIVPATRTPAEQTTTAAAVPPTPTVAPSPTPPRTYVVKAGDSYTLIAQNFGITVEQLLAANRRTAATQLFPGQLLTIP